ncbi:gamma-glutamylcyclotransferase [Pigmentiphaga aceris]|uniref:Gamma-glutamylcyclotransferase n=1 Tax=Pigmentiphaga aceris TaxID=1940612 RepID=A0A5C0ARX4_9BURK|nr:gamma-glutamylcyclotransferase family protein [Pigmentiphaga aceris]QEI04735.1 gamma-glutamylcyclotransferase [Pigmentiphaga aceris]
MRHHVFAYGTLRSGEANDLAVHAESRGLPPPRTLGQARVPGRLVDFGGWPGLIDDGTLPGVLGEVFDVDASLLPLMDEIEEHVPGVDGCFVRRSIALQLDGLAVQAHYYPIDTRFLGDAVAIDHNDWIAYRQARDKAALDAAGIE